MFRQASYLPIIGNERDLATWFDCQPRSYSTKIMFDPGVLPEVFPQTRERRTRAPLAQGTEPQEAEPAADVAAEAELEPYDEQPTEALPESLVEGFAQALDDTQATGEPVADIATAIANGKAIKAEIIENEDEGRLLVITAEPENTEAMAQPASDIPAKKPAGKGKGKKGTATTSSAD